ncbi:MAG: class I SAM-dependent methyltransferase, partial [Pseudomonadota bacterium]
MPSEVDAGSFRDRRGNIFFQNGRVYRSITSAALSDFEFVRSTGLLDRLREREQVIAEEVVDDIEGAPENAALVIEHPKLPFVSYPYEWSFNALKAAALLHLDVHLAALDCGVNMTDATAYNVQFRGATPVFIDMLSFVRYAEGEYWIGHQQFCNQFLNPLLLRAKLGVPHNAWYRGALEGIPTDELNRLLSWRQKMSWKTFTHVTLQARFQRSARTNDQALARAETRKLPLVGYKEILRGLRSWVSSLDPKDESRTDWDDYEITNSYTSEEDAAKRSYV